MILAVVAAALLAQTLSDPPLIEDKDRAPLEHVEDATPTEVDSGPAPGLPDAPRDPTLSPRQSDVSLAKGGTHLIGIGGVIGTGAAIVAIAGALINPTIREFAPSGAAAAGLFALFLGGGLAGARLLDPTPPAAWGSFWAGTAGAMLGFWVGLEGRAPTEVVLGAGALGFFAAAVPYLVLPDASTLSWKEFWATVTPGALGAGLVALVAITGNLVDPRLKAVMAVVPVASIVASRILFSIWQPFDPWVDDLKPPFRSQPIIGLGPSGASVGIAGSW